MIDKQKLAFALLLLAVVFAFIAGGAAARLTIEPEDLLPACTAEDGHRDGIPCVWTDPDTGTRYIVDSTEYLD